MSTITNNLYPPLMMDVYPSFLRDGTCRIYFSLSVYNNIEEIKNVQISLVNQKTNQSALNPTKYPSGIKIDSIKQDSTVKNDYKYYVELVPNQQPANSDINSDSGYFQINQFYIVQLRFTSTQASNPPSNGTGLESWLFNQRANFSEWSTIGLLKGIAQPNISITNLRVNQLTFLAAPLTGIAGKLYYNDADLQEKEYLKSYKLVFYKGSEIAYKTDELYTNQYNSNEFNYEVPYEFDKQVQYNLQFTYTTNNSYTVTLNYPFQITAQSESNLNATILATAQEQNGRIQLNIDFWGGLTLKENQKLTVKRASSRTNFKIWEIVRTISFADSLIKYMWYDTSIESGVWYKYKLQLERSHNRVKILEIEEPIICVFEDIFLTSGDRQLRIQFNPSIGDFKYNVMDSQQVTLGSQYPYVKRNGNNYFRSFSIGGLISSFIDDKDWYYTSYYNNSFHVENKKQTFTSPLEIYKDSKELYSNYNLQNNVSKYQDYIYERQFRQKVSDFLYENNVKLFRSLTEGNILIRLQNVAFQPIDTLGRRLYSFTATAVEMSEFTSENLFKHNLINQYYWNYKSGTYGYVDFESESSIISNYLLKQSSFTNYNIDTFKILQMNIETKKDCIIHVKIIDSQQFIRYETSQNHLYLNFDENAIEDCCFYGIHLNPNQYTLIEEYYRTTSEITNPINNGVYYILDEEQTAIINDYISYDNSTDLLVTNEENTQFTYGHDYILYANAIYEKYIYYDNHWYPFSENDDVIMPINAKITYYYETREVN